MSEPKPAEATVDKTEEVGDEAQSAFLGGPVDDLKFDHGEEEAEIAAEEKSTDEAELDKSSEDAELDKSTEQDKQDEQASDTDTETEDKPSDTETETDEPEELLSELGLSGQYKTVPEALRAVVHQRGEIEDRGRELDSMRTLISELVAAKTADKDEVKSDTIDDDALIEMFNADPRKAFTQMAEELGYVRKDDIKPIEESLGTLRSDTAWQSSIAAVQQHDDLRGVADYMRSHPNGTIPEGVNKRWDAMRGQFIKFPHLRAIPFDQAIDVAYQLTSKVGGKPLKPTVTKVPDEKKKRASTTSAGREDQSGGEIPAEILKGPSEGLRKWMIEKDLVD